MRRQRALVLAVAGLALGGWLPGTASAQQNAQLRGTWVLNRAASDDVTAKIVEATRGMNRIVGPVARRRLRATNTPYTRLTITFDAQSVQVEMPDRPAALSPAGGQPVLWNRNTGAACERVTEDCVTLSSSFQGGRLVQTFRPEDGERRNLFTVSADGATLSMMVTITSPRLARPLTYNLVYDRAN
jgi:hypothetical protein